MSKITIQSAVHRIMELIEEEGLSSFEVCDIRKKHPVKHKDARYNLVIRAQRKKKRRVYTHAAMNKEEHEFNKRPLSSIRNYIRCMFLSMAEVEAMNEEKE